jgi:molybdate transport system regulatory protein
MKRQKKTTSGNPSLIRPRIYLGPELMVGPGKIALLKSVRGTGSISAAARQLGMNYKRAWYLLDTLNQGFHQPVVEAVQGGRGGGGTRLRLWCMNWNNAKKIKPLCFSVLNRKT